MRCNESDFCFSLNKNIFVKGKQESLAMPIIKPF